MKNLRNFFKEKKVFLTILFLVIIFGGTIYFSAKQVEKITKINKLSTSVSCQNIPELTDGAIKLATKVIDGDTFLIEGGYSVRILGIDADEKCILVMRRQKIDWRN